MQALSYHSTMTHSPGSAQDPWIVILWVLFGITLVIGSAIYAQRQRREAWEIVLRNAHAWADSLGGRLVSLTEQNAVYGYRNRLVARRYQVDLIDGEGIESIAMLRFTCDDGVWSVEHIARRELQGFVPQPIPADAAAQAASNYARRHRGKIANIPVVFAQPNRRRRS